MSPTIFLSVLIVAIVTIQVSAAIPQPHLDTPFDRLIDLAKTILDFVNKLIDVTFEETESTLKTLMSKLDHLREGALTLAKTQIKMETQLVEKLMEAVKNRSSDANIDILSCLKTIETEAGRVQEEAINKSMLCIDTSIEATGTNLLSILDDLHKINVDFEAHEQKLNDCRGKLFPFECLKKVLDELGVVAMTVPTKIKADADKATMDFAALIYEIFQCSRDTTDHLKEEYVKVFNDFSQCVYDKEHPNH